jgi:hypothetical protein
MKMGANVCSRRLGLLVNYSRPPLGLEYGSSDPGSWTFYLSRDNKKTMFKRG